MEPRTVPVDGAELKRQRESKRLSIQALAAKADISRRKLQFMEAGQPSIFDACVKPVADALGIDPTLIVLGGKVPPPPKKNPNGFPAGFRKEKDFDDVTDVEDVLPLLRFLLSSGAEAEFDISIRIKRIKSVLIEMTWPPQTIIRIIVPLFADRHLEQFDITALYLSPSFQYYIAINMAVYTALCEYQSAVVDTDVLFARWFNETFSGRPNPLSYTLIDDGIAVVTPTAPVSVTSL